MPDQAQWIREIKEAGAKPAAIGAPAKGRKVVAITSGKGGVGKSNIAINLSITLTRFGHRVLIVDADVGLANLDLLLGLTPKYNLAHVVSGKKRIEEVVVSGPSGIRLLPASSSGRAYTDFTSEKRKELVDTLRSDNDFADVVFIDTGGGISDAVMEFLLLSDEVILVTTPEPTSIMDSYGIVKMLAQEKESSVVNLIVNMAEDQADAQHVSSTMRMITKQLINVKMTDLGWIGSDPHVSKAVRQQQPFVLMYPASRASKAVNRIAMRMSNCEVDFVTERGLAKLYSRVVSFLK